MKTLGLIGGTSWESTAVYYRLLNEEVRRRLGGAHSSKLLLHSVDFEPIVRLQHAGEWAQVGEILRDIAGKLEGAGADALVLCANTMHKFAPEVQASLGIPILHIADATGEALRDDGHTVVGLLGTRFTMEEAFYKERLRQKYGLDVRVPDEAGRAEIHRVIYDELCRGTIREESRKRYLEEIASLAEGGTTAVILGCTEIGLLVPTDAAHVPLYDTTVLHARMAVDFQLSEQHAPRRGGRTA